MDIEIRELQRDNKYAKNVSTYCVEINLFRRLNSYWKPSRTAQFQQ